MTLPHGSGNIHRLPCWITFQVRPSHHPLSSSLLKLLTTPASHQLSGRALGSFSTCMFWSVLSGRLEGGPVQMSGELSVPLSPLCPWTLAALASPDSKLYLLNSGRPLGSPWDVSHPPNPPPTMLWPTSQAGSWGNHKTHLICFPSLRDHCPSLSDVCCLENCCFVYLVVLNICFRWEGKSNHVTSS